MLFKATLILSSLNPPMDRKRGGFALSEGNSPYDNTILAARLDPALLQRIDRPGGLGQGAIPGQGVQPAIHDPH